MKRSRWAGSSRPQLWVPSLTYLSFPYPSSALISRREYDLRQSSYTSSGSQSSGPNYAYHYDSTSNASRRARATYAWEYQKKRSDSPRARRAGYHKDTTTSSFGSGLGAGSRPNAGSAADIFSKLAERERKKEEALNQRAANNGSAGSYYAGMNGGNVFDQRRKMKEENQDQNDSSPIFRFLQVSSVFLGVLWIGGKVGGKNENGGRRLVRNQELVKLDRKGKGGESLKLEVEIESR